MSNKKPNLKAVSSSKSKTVNTTAKAASSSSSSFQRIAQNYLLVWVDASIDEKSEDCQKILTQLRTVVNDVTTYTQPDQCIEFLKTIGDEKIFVITSGSIGQHLIPEIHTAPNVNAIYILCSDKSRYQEWIKNWAKIKGIHTDMKKICEALKMDVKQHNQDSISVSFVTTNEGASNKNLNQLEPTFMYTQIFKEILLGMEHDHQAIIVLADYCRKLYADNKYELNIINEFEHDYNPQQAIWWYTRECFTYQILNRALRTLDADTIVNMGFFIRDLHQQINDLHQQQISSYRGKAFVVYRGQGLLKTDFDKLVKTGGNLMSFNNFLSTSKNREVSLNFSKAALQNTDMVGILFIITIDPSISSTPFAAINETSYFKIEEEILFSMHTVFRVGTIKQMDNNSQLYQVKLQLTADDDEQLRILTERIREEVKGHTGWQRLGNLLLKIGQFNKAEELYKVLLEQTSNESEKALYYHQLGHAKSHQGDYEKAIEYYEKAREIQEKTLSINHPSLATSYNNIGGVYYHMKQYSKALSFYKKGLGIEENIFSSNDLSLTPSYNNMGLVYYNIGDYSQALSFYEKALSIQGKTLPPNHPDLATSYNNIGSVCKNMEEYSKALVFYEKALEIYRETLPPNHHLLATSFNNISGVYYNIKEYSKALSHSERALNILKVSLPPNHPHLKVVIESIDIIKTKL